MGFSMTLSMLGALDSARVNIPIVRCRVLEQGKRIETVSEQAGVKPSITGTKPDGGTRGAVHPQPARLHMLLPIGGRHVQCLDLDGPSSHSRNLPLLSVALVWVV